MRAPHGQTRHNLPGQPTPLLGRAAAILGVVALARRADVRLVTLTGPGGVGKTRLGIEVAAALVDDFADGVWFVRLWWTRSWCTSAWRAGSRASGCCT